MKRTLSLLILFLAAVVSVVAQCLMFPLDLDEQVSNSTLIVEGQVTGHRVFETADRSFIYTGYTIDVSTVFKGEIKGGTLEIIKPGGQTDAMVIRVEPGLHLEVGQYATFFLIPVEKRSVLRQKSGVEMYKCYASQQSVFRYDPETGNVMGVFDSYADIRSAWYRAISQCTRQAAQSIKPLAFQRSRLSGSRATISNIAPTTVTGGTYSELTITGSGFGATRGTGVVEFKNSDDGGMGWIAASPVHYQSWNNTQIVVWVPSKAGSGPIRVNPESGNAMQSAQSLDVEYSEFSVDIQVGSTQYLLQTEHRDLNGLGGITFHYHSEFNNNPAARAAFERALNKWRCMTAVNWVIGPTTPVDSAGADGINVVRFDNGNELPAGVGGRATSIFNGCFSTTYPSLHAIDIDLVFNSSLPAPLTWQFGPALAGADEVDFESVALHELGHAHQLDHVINPGKVMHFTISDGENKRTPSAADYAGADDVHSRSTGNPVVCNQPSMKNYRNVKYVDASASGIESGDLWGQAFQSLQDALASDACMDTIYIAAGTYYPDEGGGQTNNNRTALFLINSDIVLMGGYPAGGGPRDFVTNPTILSGDIDKDGVLDEDNSRTVLRFTADGHLDGLILEGGYADGNTGVARLGAGVRCNASPVVRNAILRNNSAPGNGSNGLGGAWYNAGGSPELINVLMHNNSATQDGRAIYNAGGNLSCFDCTILENH